MGVLGRPDDADEQRADQYRQWVQQRHPLAIAALVLGIFSLIELGALVVFGIAGIVLGVIALAQLRRNRVVTAENPDPERPSADPQHVASVLGDRLAWAGILLSAASLVIAGFLYLHRPI